MIFDSLRFYSLQPVFYQPAVYPFGIQLSHPQASIPFQHRRTLRHTTSSGPHQVLEHGLDFTLDVHSLPQISNGASTQHIEAQQRCVVRSQQHYRSVEGSDPSLQSSKLSLRATRFVFPTEDAHFKNEEANGETSFSLDYKVNTLRIDSSQSLQGERKLLGVDGERYRLHSDELYRLTATVKDEIITKVKPHSRKLSAAQ